jgi:hypothetical protein
MEIFREPLLQVLGMLRRLGGRDANQIETDVEGAGFDLPVQSEGLQG